MVTLNDSVRRLFDGKNFAVLSTLEPDGRPHSTVVWTKRDGDDIVFALPKNRRKSLSFKYTGGPYLGFAGPNPQWVTARITPDKVTTSWPDP
jgi:hypothetical protein